MDVRENSSIRLCASPVVDNSNIIRSHVVTGKGKRSRVTKAAPELINVVEFTGNMTRQLLTISDHVAAARGRILTAAELRSSSIIGRITVQISPTDMAANFARIFRGGAGPIVRLKSESLSSCDSTPGIVTPSLSTCICTITASLSNSRVRLDTASSTVFQPFVKIARAKVKVVLSCRQFLPSDSSFVEWVFPMVIGRSASLA